jgi:hypothetical protein
MRTDFGFGDQKSADQRRGRAMLNGGDQPFFKTFVDCGMGDNSKQSVDYSDVATISALWPKKNWLQPLYYKCPWAML